MSWLQKVIAVGAVIGIIVGLLQHDVNWLIIFGSVCVLAIDAWLFIFQQEWRSFGENSRS
ncbi:hypothetical protein IV38_GL000935 [Lactobacillus selangorensis]|uniref:Uncharacterized protein n=1 Tax=Lactobacillus selangorensis TaxID=81857 RepID=A0A0R2FZD7_9LACO|nr:hypothetical protein [Lactobacillus selangorensis]KRN28731.1 hypothetical protein IV38_GL000935 [Lactobacillus selangorensis]KRN32859.1 hypothetical protein IV40_GL000918 [Lactobacillus selangorensis]